MNTTLYLIRHCQSAPTASKPDKDWPLSETGKEQALQLADLLNNLKIEKLYSSTFLRCKETIAPFALESKMSIILNEDLRERLISDGLIDGFQDVWRKSWIDFDFALPRCESSFSAQKRFVDAVSILRQENSGKTIAVSSHGNVIGLFLNWLDNSYGGRQAEKLTNPDVIRIIFENNLFSWDHKFLLPGLENISTNYSETIISL